MFFSLPAYKTIGPADLLQKEEKKENSIYFFFFINIAESRALCAAFGMPGRQMRKPVRPDAGNGIFMEKTGCLRRQSMKFA